MPYAHNTSDRPAFVQHQYAFAARIRDPQNAPSPAGVDPQRMRVYEELFYNNIEAFLANAFPVLRTLYDDTSWHALVRGYFSSHRAQTPLFHEMPQEFLHYLQHERGAHEGNYPFMLQLAHYEWVELELLTAEDVITNVDSGGDLLAATPRLSPLTRLLSYDYAVQKIGPGHIPQQAEHEPTLLLVYRDLKDEVGFIELNPVSARLLQLIDEQPKKNGRQLLEQIAGELKHPNLQTVIDGGLEIMLDLRQRDVILGTTI